MYFLNLIACYYLPSLPLACMIRTKRHIAYLVHSIKQHVVHISCNLRTQHSKVRKKKKQKKMEDCNQKYSCRTAKETLEWINAILNFIKPYAFLTNAHVTNFFTHKLWQSIDPVWLHCLRNEPVQNLLLIPCGIIQVTK